MWCCCEHGNVPSVLKNVSFLTSRRTSSLSRITVLHGVFYLYTYPKCFCFVTVRKVERNRHVCGRTGIMRMNIRESELGRVAFLSCLYSNDIVAAWNSSAVINKSFLFSLVGRQVSL